MTDILIAIWLVVLIFAVDHECHASMENLSLR